MMSSSTNLAIDVSAKEPPTRVYSQPPNSLPPAKAAQLDPKYAPKPGESPEGNASLYFVGTATTVLEWEGLRLLTDPNFLHAGDHVHLGPGVTGTRLTEPAIPLRDLPSVDVVLLSHYHADHFDQVVEDSLRRDLPIITTPHAKGCLSVERKGEDGFTNVHALDTFEWLFMDLSGGGIGDEGRNSKIPRVKVTAMPGKHVPTGLLSTLNDLVAAVPPTNGWMLELGYNKGGGNESFQCGYRIYITGDTLMVDELKEIPERYKDQNIDLMLIHLGGTTIPGPKMPLLMVTMDAKQGIQLIKLIHPDLTIPIHFDDYDVFLSPLEDFKKSIQESGLDDKVVYLDRGDSFKFNVDV